MAKTRAQQIRATRQEELREYLSKRGLVAHVIDQLEKIDALSLDAQEALLLAKEADPDLDPILFIKQHEAAQEFELKKFQASSQVRMKLINKYLPDMKFVESEVDANLSGSVKWIVDASGPDTPEVSPTPEA